MKLKKPRIKDIVFLVIIILLIVPQTRKPIQVFVNKGLALFSPSVSSKENRSKLNSYNWQLENSNKQVINFNDTKGKVVLVNFWATWCPPCIAEMPSLQDLYNDYNDKIEFLFVTDESFEVVNAFLTKNKYSFDVYRPMSNYNEIFEIKSIPRTFLIDQKGTIVIDKIGAANWNSNKVRETINELIQSK